MKIILFEFESTLFSVSHPSEFLLACFFCIAYIMKKYKFTFKINLNHAHLSTI
jgi:hypothetical protein